MNFFQRFTSKISRLRREGTFPMKSGCSSAIPRWHKNQAISLLNFQPARIFSAALARAVVRRCAMLCHWSGVPGRKFVKLWWWRWDSWMCQRFFCLHWLQCIASIAGSTIAGTGKQWRIGASKCFDFSSYQGDAGEMWSLLDVGMNWMVQWRVFLILGEITIYTYMSYIYTCLLIVLLAT